MTLNGPTHTPKHKHKRRADKMYEDMVPKFYRMNPETEELIPYGWGLRNGMEVLIAETSQRVNLNLPMADWEIDRAMVNNRWCKVTDVYVDKPGQTVTFVGIYEDGTKEKRTRGLNCAWVVKKETIFEAPDGVMPYELKKARIEKIVQETVTEALRIAVTEDIVAEAISNGVSEMTAEETGRKLDMMVEKYVRKLLNEL